MSENLQTKQAVATDAAALGRLHGKVWLETYRGLLPDAALTAISAGRRTEMWRRFLKAPERGGSERAYLLLDEGNLIGFASCGPQRQPALAGMGYSGELYAVYILKAFHGRSGGRFLCRASAADLVSRGHDRASVSTLSTNLAARRFFERLQATELDLREPPVFWNIAQTVLGWDAPRLRQLAGMK
ncbi:MAG TPA: GNAT family N-acetyltransferase [Allosphingosinicella sp.]|nr:GNAT family N-acetyltransferase [Allosphingosinicella sp.]